jgi:hypothetical protein
VCGSVWQCVAVCGSVCVLRVERGVWVGLLQGGVSGLLACAGGRTRCLQRPRRVRSRTHALHTRSSRMLSRVRHAPGTPGARTLYSSMAACPSTCSPADSALSAASCASSCGCSQRPHRHGRGRQRTTTRRRTPASAPGQRSAPAHAEHTHTHAHAHTHTHTHTHAHTHTHTQPQRTRGRAASCWNCWKLCAMTYSRLSVPPSTRFKRLRRV